MYLPKHFQEPNPAVLHALIKDHPLGAWVTYCDGELLVNHIPFLLDPSRGEHGTLIGHVARANPVWRVYSKEIASIIIFQGPQAYISPSWMPTKQETGKMVPTWNYAVVHAHGLPCVIEDRAKILQIVSTLTEVHEAGQAVPWAVSDAPPDYIEAMLGAIIGIEIPLTRLTGKWKVSQNRSTPDKQGVVAGLNGSGDAGMAELVGRFILNSPVGS
jgi:transcriptional regulator